MKRRMAILGVVAALIAEPSFAALKPGDAAPDFKTQASLAGNVFTFSLAEALKKGPVVLYFYPADFTPTCTREACMFRDSHPELAARGVRVVGVNASRCQTHARFRAKLELPFILLSDPERTAARAYGAAGMLGFVRRIFVRFTITDQRLRIQRGILSRRVQQTRIDRVQNVNTRQRPLERLLHVGAVDFDTAGTDDSDFTFDGVNDPTGVAAAVDRAQRIAAERPRGGEIPGGL